MLLTGPELQDRGLHLRGLVQMMAADRVLAPAQRAHIHAWAAAHGFEAAYVDAAIDSVLENQHFPTAPPRFSNRPAAEAFLRAAALVAVCDGELHPQEREWLLAAAHANGIDAQVALQAIEDSPLPGPAGV
jgi:DnaJ-domain-containing protein 1